MFNPKQNILDHQLAESGVEVFITWNDAKDFGLDLVTGGAHSANKSAKKQANISNKASKKLHRFNKKEAKRENRYSRETLKITKRNNKANIKYQEAVLKQNYLQAKAVQQYEDRQALRAYNKSVATAQAQLTYNDLASKAAKLDQDRYFQEQLLDLKFDKLDTISNYRYAAAGINVKRKQAQAEAKFAVQRSGLQALKAEAEVAARGQAGQSVAALQSGISAEAGANQAEIIAALLSTEQGLDIDLQQMNDQLIMDRTKLAMSEVSLRSADVSARYQIDLQRAQADMNAQASIELHPEKQPPLPKPFKLPRPEYQNIYKKKAPPRAARVIAPQQNLAVAGINTVANYASMALGIYNAGGPNGAGLWGS